jgi:hypothetical protein
MRLTKSVIFDRSVTMSLGYEFTHEVLQTKGPLR